MITATEARTYRLRHFRSQPLGCVPSLVPGLQGLDNISLIIALQE
jgi:hypothetical protein